MPADVAVIPGRDRSGRVRNRGRMGLRDALRSLRGGATTPAEEIVSDAEAPEPSWFQPRYDGRYDAPLADSRVSLRFLPGGKVFESEGIDATPGPEQQNPCRGEYTAAGRFNVQRRFERIISYAVLEMQADGFHARRINGADRSTVELPFAFVPDNAGRAPDGT